MLNPMLAIASVFGPFMVLLGIWMLLFSKNVEKIWSSLKSTPSTFFLMSLLDLFAGLFIISEHNFWFWDKSILITLLGWTLFIRGLAALFFPAPFVKYAMSGESLAKWIGIIPLLWGAFLSWIAFA